MASGGDDATVRIWDLDSRREIATLRGHISRIMCVAFTPDGNTLASGCESVRLWDVASGREAANLRGNDMAVSSLAISPDGRRLASGSWDGTVRIWDVNTGRETATLRGHKSAVWSVAFSPDGRVLTSCGGGVINAWDATPVTTERRAHREALSLVRFTIARAASPSDARDRIRRSVTVPEDVRMRAMQLVDDHWKSRVHSEGEDLVVALFEEGRLPDEVEEALQTRGGLKPEVRASALEELRNWPLSAATLDEASWKVVRQCDLDTSEYLQARRRAETACRYDPDYGTFLSTLGVAQCRLGLYREALETLNRSYALNRDSDPPELGFRLPADLAFLAMSQQRLGDSDAARQTLAQLRAALKAPGPNLDFAENAAFLCEAEAVIELDPAFPADPFAP
jgi:hypothetical protein